MTVNFKDIFEAQKKLDEAFIKSIEDKEQFNDFELKKIIALLVELGEFANEIQEFKYWKKHKNINKVKVLEEYADGLHFLTSLAIKYNINSEININIKEKNFNKQLKDVYVAFSLLFKDINTKNVYNAYSLYLGLAFIIKLNEKEIKEWYFKKNEINYKRIANNY